jgi:hypothetical protein
MAHGMVRKHASNSMVVGRSAPPREKQSYYKYTSVISFNYDQVEVLYMIINDSYWVFYGEILSRNQVENLHVAEKGNFNSYRK